MTEVIKDLASLKRLRNEFSPEAKTVGFVPTMGNLHAGHLSLIDRSLDENQTTFASIFVNPTQFDDQKDLETYPRTFDADLEAIRQRGVDYVFSPSAKELYPDDFRYRVSESDLSQRFCGKHRPGHFDGVLTVVMKLLLLVRPSKAYFGIKDYQQYLLVKGMAEAFFLDTEIVPCPIVRDSDGIALSSRNVNLSQSERVLATRFAEAMRQRSDSEQIATMLEGIGMEVDYIEEYQGRRLGAVRIGSTRLIDNVPLGES